MSDHEAAEHLAAGVRSFLSSLPFMAPETVGLQARVKLAEPLAEFERSPEPSGESGPLREALERIATMPTVERNPDADPRPPEC